MPTKALIVVDMLNDFIKEDGSLYCGKTSQTIIPFIKEKIRKFRQEKSPIIFLQDSHDPDDSEFDLFGKHCVTGSEGGKIIEEIEVKDEDYIVPKKTYDGYYKSDLGKILEENQVEEVHLVGVCTSICVMETSSSLAKRGYKLVIYKEGVADFDPEAHDFALKHMEKIYGVKIT